MTSAPKEIARWVRTGDPAINGDDWTPPEWFELFEIAATLHMSPWQLRAELDEQPIVWRRWIREWMETRARIRSDAEKDAARG